MTWPLFLSRHEMIPTANRPIKPNPARRTGEVDGGPRSACSSADAAGSPIPAAPDHVHLCLAGVRAFGTGVLGFEMGADVRA